MYELVNNGVTLTTVPTVYVNHPRLSLIPIEETSIIKIDRKEVKNIMIKIIKIK